MKITVWRDYGCEGWGPTDFESVEDAVEFVSNGYNIHGPYRVTVELALSIETPPPSPLQQSVCRLLENLHATPLTDDEQASVAEFIGGLRRFAPPPNKEEPK